MIRINFRTALGNASRGTFSTALNKLLIGLPFLTMVFVGVRGRTQDNDFQFLICPPSEAKKIAAYAPYVGLAEHSLLPLGASPAWVAKEIGLKWLQGQRTGDLQRIAPANFSDLATRGAKREIVAGNERIVETLNTKARAADRNGEFQAAIDDALLATQVLQVTESFDLFTLGMTSLDERTSLERIKEALPHVPATERASVKSAVEKLRFTPANLEPLLLNMRWILLSRESEKSMSQQELRDVEAEFPLDQFLAARDFTRLCSSAITTVRTASEPDAQDAAELIYLAYRGAQRTNERIDAIVAA